MSGKKPEPYGIIGGFREPEQLVAVVRQIRAEGFTRWDAYLPAPIEEIDALVPTRRGAYVTIVMVCAGFAGACLGYFMQWWPTVVDYPLNVGGRPLNGWPGFVPTAWEVCALFTVYFGFFAFLLLCRLTQLWQPIFTAPYFERASQDEFFICIEAKDRAFDRGRIEAIFRRHGATSVSEIAA